MKVTVQQKEPKAWAGLNQYKNCYTDVATYWLKNGNKYTGLTEEDEDRLGKELGADLKPNSSYWDSDKFFIRMTGDPIILDLDDPFDELKYLFLKSHKLVQPSLSEPKATAHYVMINYEEEAKEENKRSKIKRKAMKEFDKLSAVDIKKALRLYGIKAESTSAEQNENKLFDMVEKDPANFIDLWVNNKNRDTQFLVESALSNNVMRRNKNAYYYGTEILGYSMEDAIAFLDNPKNNDIKIAIKNGINAKK